ncbi:MAG: hypothetical protein ABR555_16510 [Pyrinomonadaceae bacterium]
MHEGQGPQWKLSDSTNAYNHIDTILDTLGRTLTFNYDANGWLTSITQVWNRGTINQTTHM